MLEEKQRPGSTVQGPKAVPRKQQLKRMGVPAAAGAVTGQREEHQHELEDLEDTGSSTPSRETLGSWNWASACKSEQIGCALGSLWERGQHGKTGSAVLTSVANTSFNFHLCMCMCIGRHHVWTQTV